MILPSFPIMNIEQMTGKDLGVTPLFQHKDTPMLCLRGCPLEGKHAWNVVHEVSSSSDVASCDHCKWYCVVASIAMINHYFGGDISQDRLMYYIRAELYRDYYNPPETDIGHGIGLDVDSAKDALSWSLNGADPGFEDYFEKGEKNLHMNRSKNG